MTQPTDERWTNYVECTCEDHPRLTVQHFLFDCPDPERVQRRNDLQESLSQVNPKFTEMEYFNNIKNILFPRLYYKSSELRTYDNLVLRHKHLQWVINYCRYGFPD